MAKQKVIHTTKADVEARKSAIASRAVRALVVGTLPIRDAVDREDRVKGEIVRLDPETALIGALIDAGNVELVSEEEAAA